MKRQPQQHSSERGSVMVIMMVSLGGLLALSMVTLLKVTRGFRASSQSRFQSMALFAAESGISAGMEFLRSNVSPANRYSDFVSASNSSIQAPLGIAGNAIEAGDPGNLFSSDANMMYTVSILNNSQDETFTSGADSDGVVILRSVGRGPGTSMVILEVEVDGSSTTNTGRPCPGYAQRGIAEDGAGRNDCLTDIDADAFKTFSPGL